jgi:hypothetical protein
MVFACVGMPYREESKRGIFSGEDAVLVGKEGCALAHR